jgi:hypothetical protein
MSGFINQLKEVLHLLAAEGQEQLRYLDEIGVEGNVDELALEFDDIVRLAKSRFEIGEITAQQLDRINEINSMLDSMSGQENAALWTPEALLRSPQWESVRNRARLCLECLLGGKYTGQRSNGGLPPAHSGK